MTDARAIRHLWTHKTQDHPFLSDEELVIDHAEGVWVWTEQGKKLLDGFAGLAVVNVGHGRREIAEAVAEQTVRLAYYPTTRQFSNRPAAELAAELARSRRATSTSPCSRSAAPRPTSARCRSPVTTGSGQDKKYKVISQHGGYHGATAGTFAVCGLPHLSEAYAPLSPPGSPRSRRRTRSATAARGPTPSWSPGAPPSCARRSCARVRRRCRR